jgi:fermentation-respiration switch protein FrsA (DUF1100 family)
VIILLICLGLYTLLAAFLYATQARHVYFPTGAISATPEHLGVPYEEVAFTTGDKVRLAGWYVPAVHPKGTVLFCHGNGGNISYLLETVKLFRSLEYNLLVFDYRGYGASDGTPTEEGTYRDAEAAYDYLVKDRGILPGTIVLMGRSLGGSVAAWLAQRHLPPALILESTFTSLSDMAAEVYPYFPVRWMLRFRYATIDRLPDLRCPVLIIHSRADEVIPFRHGRELWEKADEPKAFLEIQGGHNEGFLLSADIYAAGIRDFLKAHCPRM